MIAEAFRNLFWGFLCDIIDFRVKGIDILPDSVGFICFGKALAVLGDQNESLNRSRKLNPVLMVLSLLHLYEPHGGEDGFLAAHHTLMTVLGLVILALEILHIFDLLMGIKEMAEKEGKLDVAHAAQSKWHQYLGFKALVILGLLVDALPQLKTAYSVTLYAGMVALAISIGNYMKKCGKSFG